MCDNCLHDTWGNNCEKCLPYFQKNQHGVCTCNVSPLHPYLLTLLFQEVLFEKIHEKILGAVFMKGLCQALGLTFVYTFHKFKHKI